jgi:hypothetical protein
MLTPFCSFPTAVCVFSAKRLVRIEASLSGGVLDRRSTESLPPYSTITGASLTPGGLYVSVQAAPESLSPQPAIYRLEIGGKWVPVDAFAVLGPDQNGIIIGSDHDQLVMAVGLPRVVWTKEQ